MFIKTSTLLAAAHKGLSVADLLDEIVTGSITEDNGGHQTIPRAEPKLDRRHRAERRDVERDENELPRKRTRAANPSKLYRALTVKRGRNAGQPVEPAVDLPAGYVPTWNVLRKARKPMTARDINKATGDKPKQTESALWFLRRQAECVESIPNGETK